MNIDFRRSAKKEKIEAGEQYYVPAGSNCVRVSNGYLSFGKANMNSDFHKSANGARFFRIPKDAESISFPYFKKNPGGYKYGEISWEIKT